MNISVNRHDDEVFLHRHTVHAEFYVRKTLHPVAISGPCPYIIGLAQGHILTLKDLSV